MYYLVFECQTLQGVREKYPDLFGEYAVTRCEGHEAGRLHGVAKVITDCLEVYADAGPIESQTCDQP